MGLLITGLRGRLVETQVILNGAIHRSMRLAGLVACTGFILTVATIGAIYGLTYGACTGLFTATILWLWFGGMATIEHWVLRALLRLEGVRFCDASILEAAADRGLVHRVGGGHMFLHPLFLEHLATRFERRVSPAAATI